jgi:hypothetical protein
VTGVDDHHRFFGQGGDDPLRAGRKNPKRGKKQNPEAETKGDGYCGKKDKLIGVHGEGLQTRQGVVMIFYVVFGTLERIPVPENLQNQLADTGRNRYNGKTGGLYREVDAD